MTPKQIKSARLRAGLSQGALAQILGTHAMTISKWERGERQPDSSAVAALRMLVWAKDNGVIDQLTDYLRT
ncbi:MAG: helix-turn-helix domain-containing protein [Candidatus Thiodiazotropha lotti]|nr:helix-turn-helix domain-containing protein [Candidatus Thiodiazotropha lotti]MCW4188335.1 helix-turn-helix domain-containing protein [Candidatus Thiodiazotropha lotti]